MASYFEEAAASLRLSQEAKARAWEMLLGTRIGPEDPEAVRVLLHVAMLEDAERVKSAGREVLDDAASVIGATAKTTAVSLTQAASKVEKASLAKLAANNAELSSKLGADIADAADRALTRKIAVLSRNTLAAWVLTVGVLATCVGTGGYVVGKRYAEANGAAVSAVLQREDGAAWVKVMAGNNMAGSLAAYCGAGNPNVRRVDGGTICSMPLWLTRDGVVGQVAGRPAEGGAVLAAVSGWLASWGPWWLLAAGAVSLLLVRKAGRLLAVWPPVAWLLDLPPRQEEMVAGE